MPIVTTRQKIASLRPDSTNEAQLCAFDSDSSGDVLLSICNQDTSDQTYYVAHTDSGHGDNAADSDDWIVYGKTIPAGGEHKLTLHVGNSETIRVKASVVSKISFVISGTVHGYVDPVPLNFYILTDFQDRIFTTFDGRILRGFGS